MFRGSTAYLRSIFSTPYYQLYYRETDMIRNDSLLQIKATAKEQQTFKLQPRAQNHFRNMGSSQFHESTSSNKDYSKNFSL